MPVILKVRVVEDDNPDLKFREHIGDVMDMGDVPQRGWTAQQLADKRYEFIYLPNLTMADTYYLYSFRFATERSAQPIGRRGNTLDIEALKKKDKTMIDLPMLKSHVEKKPMIENPDSPEVFG